MFESILSVVLSCLPIVVIVVLLAVLLVSTIKVVSGNEVLVVTGIGATKKVARKITVPDPDGSGATRVENQITYAPTIKIAGAAFVIPIFQRSRKFDICVKKAAKTNDAMKTKTGVEIVIDWSISYAPNADTVDSLQPCIRQFLDKAPQETEEIVMSSVAGGMRAVISTMTPQEVMVGKETLDEAVQRNISAQMAELGYKVQIYIQEVRDIQGSSYYSDLAARDREETRQRAAIITAEADQAIREKAAMAEQKAKEAELDSEVAIAARTRDAAVQKAQFQIETDRANADAAVAGQLQTTERQRELTEKEGQVEVMRQEQADLAAKAAQTVAITQAETSKKEAIIKTEAESEQKKISAQAAAAVNITDARGRADAMKATAEGEAEAAKAKSLGEAEAAKARAAGEAEATKLRAAAEAEKISTTGEAEAKAIKAKGEAEAAAIQAKGEAEAKAARDLSDAQAANDRVNFEITKLEIQRDTTVQVVTNIATVMAKLGENATFYDFGGRVDGGKSDLLTGVLGNIPSLLAKANLENQALNGAPFTDTIQQLMESFAGPLNSAGNKKMAVRDAGEAMEEVSTVNSTADDDSTERPSLPMQEETGVAQPCPPPYHTSLD